MEEVQNILEKGYSTFSQAAMKDTALHIKSKAIYLFLCSYKNVDNIATPKRETIMNYLQIGSEHTYYKYIKELESLGYISIKTLKVRGKFFNNEYKINTHVNGNNIFEKYGIIPREFMNDKNIPIEAKGLYGYFCSYRNKATNDVVFTDVKQMKYHLGIVSSERLNKNIKILIDAGYINKKKNKNGNKYSSNLYTLLGYRENISVKESKLSVEELSEVTQKNIEARDSKKKINKQVVETEKKVEKEMKVYEGYLKTNLKYNMLEEDEKKIKNIQNNCTDASEIRYYMNNLNLNEEIFGFTNDIINIILRKVFSNSENIKFADVEYSRTFIKEMFLKLSLEHIYEVLNRYKKALNSNYIANPSAYIEMVLHSVCYDYNLVKMRTNVYEPCSA